MQLSGISPLPTERVQELYSKSKQIQQYPLLPLLITIHLKLNIGNLRFVYLLIPYKFLALALLKNYLNRTTTASYIWEPHQITDATSPMNSYLMLRAHFSLLTSFLQSDHYFQTREILLS